MVSDETHQAGCQVPRLPKSTPSDVFENNITGCIEFQRKFDTHDEQVASKGKNRPGGIARRRKFNSASAVSSGTQQAVFQEPFPQRRIQKYDFVNNATGSSSHIRRKDGKSLCNDSARTESLATLKRDQV